MSESANLEDLVQQPFDLLRELERRSRHAPAAGSGTADERVGVAFRIGEEQFVARREQVREVLMLPDSVTRVPGAKTWLLGIANLRGHLLPLIDVKLLLGSGRTSLRRSTRVVSINHREIPAGLVVDEVLGFRRFREDEYSDQWPETAVRCDRFIAGAYRHDDEAWPIFNFFDFVESNLFLQAAAE